MNIQNRQDKYSLTSDQVLPLNEFAANLRRTYQLSEVLRLPNHRHGMRGLSPFGEDVRLRETKSLKMLCKGESAATDTRH